MANRLAELETTVLQYRKKNGQKRQTTAQAWTGSKRRRVRALTGTVDYQVPGAVPVVPQPTGMTCWAAVLTALVNWRDQLSRPIGEVLREINPSWAQMFDADQGLSSSAKDRLVQEAGLESQRGINLSPQGWQSLLREHGPVWVTVDMRPGQPGGIHARIVTGIHGDGTGTGTTFDIIDPARGGQTYSERMDRFIRRYEAEVIETGRTRIQLIYWPAGTGNSSLQRSLSKMSPRRRRRRTQRPMRAFNAVEYTAPGTVPILEPPSGHTHWAAVYTMMASWKENRPLEIPGALDAVGPAWRQLLDQGGALGVDRVTDFLAQTGLVAEPSMSLTADVWEQLLRDFGPLLVTLGEDTTRGWAGQGRVVTGIQGDSTAEGTQLAITDPGKGGARYNTPLVGLPQSTLRIYHWPRGARQTQAQSVFPYASASSQALAYSPPRTTSYSIARRSPGVIAFSQSFDLRYDVPLVFQQNAMSCWAAACATIVGWRDQQSINPADLAAGAGYWTQYRDLLGLNPDDVAFFQRWGLVAEPPQTQTVEGFHRLLQDYGPLACASAMPSAHWRVVTGIQGDGTPEGTNVFINDPGPVGRGSQYTETYRQFVTRQSQLAGRELPDYDAPIYVAHLPQLPDWVRNPIAQSLGYLRSPMQMALSVITHAGPYRLARMSRYGVIESQPRRDTRQFWGEPALQDAVNTWAGFLPQVMNAPQYILTSGLYTPDGGEYHRRGLAIDVSGFWWAESDQYMATEAEDDWIRYLRIGATLRKAFGTVLNYDYNAQHRNHWHCSVRGTTNWRGVETQAFFAQRVLKEVFGENSVAVDGQWGPSSQQAAQRHGFDFTQAAHWDRFLDDLIAGVSR